MSAVYLDNGSTTFPKPEAVPDAMYQYITSVGCNINRGAYQQAYWAEEAVYETRQLLCGLLKGPNCKNVVFTKNATESLNIILKGLLKPGDHVLVSSVEHNAIMRPLVQLEQIGIAFSRIPCLKDGSLCLEQAQGLLQPNTKAVIMTHASNVCGTLLPIEAVGGFCRRHNLYFVVDSAQTAGVYPIDMEAMGIDALAFTGHKGLLGPQGIGGFILADGLAPNMEPLLSGGTGSLSHTEDIPDFMPDRFEPGTPNLPGIIGLREGLRWLETTGLDAVRTHELHLTQMLLDRLLPMESEEKLCIIGRKDTLNRTGVVSIQTLEHELSQVAYQLDALYGIMTRVGLHCAPAAHKTLGTYPLGTIRFSFGWWNTESDVIHVGDSLKDILYGA